MLSPLNADYKIPVTYPGVVLFYGVVSAQTEKVVEFFLEGRAGGRIHLGG
jgi:hypothetical protein